jgi:hypothetical protein
LDQLATTHCNATFELKVQTAAGRMLVREHSKHRDSFAWLLRHSYRGWSFPCYPRVGHMHQLQRVCGYLRESPDAAIRFHTGIPNYDDHEIPKHDWMYSVYGATSEEMPTGMPTPKCNTIRTTSFVDANMMHDLITGRSATGILHFLKMPQVRRSTSAACSVFEPCPLAASSLLKSSSISRV